MNHGILSSLAPNFVTCSLLSLSLWGKKTLSLLGERGEERESGECDELGQKRRETLKVFV